MTFAHPDFQMLFDWLLKVSKNLLKTQGAFLPTGAIVSPEGKLGAVGAYTKDEKTRIPEALQLLEGGLREMAKKGMCRAVGMAFDTRLKAAPRKDYIGKDAIWMILEEKGGLSQGVVVPYAKSWLSGYEYEEAFTLPETPHVFGRSTR